MELVTSTKPLRYTGNVQLKLRAFIT